MESAWQESRVDASVSAEGKNRLVEFGRCGDRNFMPGFEAALGEGPD